MPYPLIYTGNFQASGDEASGGKTIELGFVPEYVKVFNKTADTIFELLKDMDSEKSVKWERIKDDGATGDYNFTYQSSGGIELVDTTTINTGNPVQQTKEQGFKIPSGELTEDDYVYWIAMRNA